MPARDRDRMAPVPQYILIIATLSSIVASQEPEAENRKMLIRQRTQNATAAFRMTYFGDNTTRSGTTQRVSRASPDNADRCIFNSALCFVSDPSIQRIVDIVDITKWL